MKVRIVCYEEIGAWILGKFATKLVKNLNKAAIDADIANHPDAKADINHHICYLGFQGPKSSIDTLMITHVDSWGKLKLLKEQLQQAEMGICLSSFSVAELSSAGIPKEKLCFVLPGQDGLIRPRPTVIGITTRIYPDGRKKEKDLLEICQQIDPHYFEFKIIGDGWQPIVQSLRQMGFKIEYVDQFDLALYNQMLPLFDYYLYLGLDEGSLGFLDALAAAVPTVVTPQGFHLDIPGSIQYPVKTTADVVQLLRKIEKKKKHLASLVSELTWERYAEKHAEVWSYLLHGRSARSFVIHENKYGDGLASLHTLAKPAYRQRFLGLSLKWRLLRNSLLRRWRKTR